jgi:hypothetical protein
MVLWCPVGVLVLCVVTDPACQSNGQPYIHIALTLTARCLLPESYTKALLKCFIAVLVHIRWCFVGIGVITV